MTETCARRLAALALAGLSITWFAASVPRAQGKPQLELKAAMDKEVVDGDLKAAIEMYRRLTQSSDRGVRARAWLRMGQCYEKLGDAEARKAYQSVVRDFGDQKDIAEQARARLAALTARVATTSAGPSSRKLWTATSDATLEKVSPDGRHLAFTAWNESGTSADLVLHDLASGADRRLTSSAVEKGDTAENAVFSRDGRQIAYTWYTGNGPALRAELRIVNVAGTGTPEPRRLLSDHEELKYVWPYDWSADGNWIAVTIFRKDSTRQVALVATADGTVRVLKASVPEGLNAMAISTDGKYLAFDRYAGDTRARDVVLLALDTGREVPAVVSASDDGLVGWSPDGTRLLFTSDRSGSNDLWAQRMQDGRPLGAPEFIKGDVGRYWSLGIGASGALYTAADNNRPATEVKTGSFDFANGQWLSPPMDTRQSVSESSLTPSRNPSPDWSPDGKSFAYSLDRSHRSTGLNTNPVVVIRSVDTTEIREVRPKLESLIGMMFWAPDGKAFISGGRSFDGPWGIWRIDAQTGDASLLASGGEAGGTLTIVLGVSSAGKVYRAMTGSVMELDLATGRETPVAKGVFNLIGASPDGRKVYFRRAVADDEKSPDAERGLFERDVATGQEREVYRGRILEASACRLSPDGRLIAAITTSTTSRLAVLAVPVDGGKPRELMVADAPAATAPGAATRPALALLWFGWAPDSQSLFVRTNRPGEASEIWWNPVDGRSPKRVDIGSPGDLTYVRVHPDGRRIAFGVASGDPFKPYDVWVFEGLLPKPSPAQAKGK